VGQCIPIRRPGTRLPSALAGGIAVFLTGLLGRRLVGAAAGLWGALILALCLQLTVEAKVATVDATLLAIPYEDLAASMA